jgi:hypothetical protein
MPAAVVMCNLMIWNAAIYCAQVARSSVMVHCAELWFTREGRQIECR